MQSDPPVETTGSLGEEPSRLLARQYNVITIGGALILVVVVGTLFFLEWRSQQEREQSILQKNVNDRSTALDNFISRTPFYISQLQTSAAYHLTHGSTLMPELEDLPQDAADATYFAIDTVPAGFPLEDLGNLFGTGSYRRRIQTEDRAELLAALSLFPVFKAAHAKIPDFFAWSYYQSAQNFTAIYPWSATRDIVGHDPNLTLPTVIANVMALDLMKLGLPENNPERASYWTPVYLDPGGKGLMVTHGAPVYAGDRFYGIVCTDVALQQITEYTDNLGYEDGLFLVVNERDEVLATSRVDKLNRGNATKMADLIPPSLKGKSLNQKGVTRIADHFVVGTRLASVPWTVYFLAPVSDLNRMGYGAMLVYLLTLVGLSLFLVTIYVVLLRRFVIPAVALTAHIRAEAAEGSSHMPDVTPLWQPWFQTVSDTFALKTVTANLPGAIYQLRQETNKKLVTQFISQGISELAGIRQEQVEREGWMQLIVAEDRRRLMTAIEQAALDLKPFFYECRLRTSQGRQKWIRLASKPRRETDGNVMLEGLLLDITKRKEAEDALRESEERIRSILDAPLVPIVITNLDTQRITFANDRGAQLFHMDPDEAIGCFGPDYWMDNDARRDIFHAIRRKGRVENFEVRIVKEGGTAFWALLSAIPMTYLGEPSLLITLNDITERKSLEEELKRAATIDFLTNAYNRRHFLHLGRREFARAVRHRCQLTVLMMDIDHFKKVNDTYGHPAGDETIRVVAQTCLNSIRSIDIFGRLGGEEFAAVLPETNLKDAILTAERLRQTIQAMAVSYEQYTISFTVSIGVTALTASDTTIESLLDRADKALYMAKNGGRNQVVFLPADDTTD